MWLMSIVFAMLIISVSLITDLASFNTATHRSADNNNAYVFLKNVHKAVSLLKDDPATIEESGDCLANSANNTYVSSDCINYGMNGGFSVSGSQSPLYDGHGKWGFRHVGGVIKYVIPNHNHYYIFINKGSKVNHGVYALIPQDKYTIVGFNNKGKIVTPAGLSSCRWIKEGEAPCSSVPASVPEGALIVVL